MAAPYLTPAEAITRLAAYGIKGAPRLAELVLASNILDLTESPFIGERLTLEQHRAFPRTITVLGDTPNVVPDPVLDWTALQAHRFGLDDDAPHAMEKIDTISVSFAGEGKQSRESRLMAPLLEPYRPTGSDSLGSYPII